MKNKSKVLYILVLLFVLTLGILYFYPKITPRVVDLQKPASREVEKRIGELYYQSDSDFKKMLQNQSNWKVYTHPKEYFTFKYPTDLEIKTNASENYIGVTLNKGGNDKFLFGVNPYGWGGGSLCANSYCYSVPFDSIKLNDGHGFYYFFEPDERFRNIHYTYFEYRYLIVPTKVSDFAISVTAHYENEDQRNVVKAMVESLKKP